MYLFFNWLYYIMILISTKLYDLSSSAYTLQSPQTRIHRIKKPPTDKTAAGISKEHPAPPLCAGSLLYDAVKHRMFSFLFVFADYFIKSQI